MLYGFCTVFITLTIACVNCKIVIKRETLSEQDGRYDGINPDEDQCVKSTVSYSGNDQFCYLEISYRGHLPQALVNFPANVTSASSQYLMAFAEKVCTCPPMKIHDRCPKVFFLALLRVSGFCYTDIVPYIQRGFHNDLPSLQYIINPYLVIIKGKYRYPFTNEEEEPYGKDNGKKSPIIDSNSSSRGANISDSTTSIQSKNTPKNNIGRLMNKKYDITENFYKESINETLANDLSDLALIIQNKKSDDEINELMNKKYDINKNLNRKILNQTVSKNLLNSTSIVGNKKESENKTDHTDIVKHYLPSDVDAKFFNNEIIDRYDTYDLEYPEYPLQFDSGINVLFDMPRGFISAGPSGFYVKDLDMLYNDMNFTAVYLKSDLDINDDVDNLTEVSYLEETRINTQVPLKVSYPNNSDATVNSNGILFYCNYLIIHTLLLIYTLTILCYRI